MGIFSSNKENVRCVRLQVVNGVSFGGNPVGGDDPPRFQIEAEILDGITNEGALANQSIASP